tara:strand:+ start:469 stop:657 length:189 start_codon:yes stop_codon:yes gene_type:complete
LKKYSGIEIIYFKLKIHLRYILIGRVSAVMIKTINNEYLTTPNLAYISLSIVLANNGGKIRK